jgi:N-formylglutamate amidohydrolase
MKKTKRKIVSRKIAKTGKPTGRAALERLEELTQRYAATLQRILTELQQIRAVIP